MSDKETPATAADVLPPKSKGNQQKTDLELYLATMEKAETLKAGVLGDFQRRLQTLATDKKLLEEKGFKIDWTAPEFNQALGELGLMAPVKYLVTTSRKQPSTNYKEGTVKYKVLECLKDGKIKSIDNIAAQTKLDKAKLGIPLGQMRKKDKTVKKVGRGEYQIAAK